MKLLPSLRLGVLSLFLFLTACGGGGGDSAPAAVHPQPDPASWLQGSAVNSPLVGAEIKLFRFDTDGTEVEIVAGSAPVLTGASGEYKFWITGGSIDASTGPLILRSYGGTMNSAAAPTLEAVLADSSGLQADGATLTQHLSVGSSVAASLVRLQATQAAAAPIASDAAGLIALVEQQLAIGLDQDPSDLTQPLAIYAQSVDENLGLSQTPDNAPAINEFIDYLALNLNSDSGQLDNTMQDPATGLMVPASFNNIGTGLLASLVPQGPASFQTVKISLDKREIENDGMDTAFLTATLVDGTGAPVADGTVVMYENTAGRVVFNKNRAGTLAGKSRVNISSVWAGDAQVRVLYEGANSELKSIPVNLSVVDKVDDVPDTVPPKVSSAGATSNTQILVSFSEAMRGGMEGAENPAHYRISGVEPLLSQKTSDSGSSKVSQSNQVNAKPEARVIAAELILPDRNTVRLTTLSQSDLLYAVRVVNLTDVNGNGMSAGEQFDTDPTRAEFQGIAPSGAEIVDTDGDGLSDSDEQRGWIVSTVSAAGVVLTFEVTSDPLNADTDGDGVTDNEEFHGGFNPRTEDSDGDTLTDNQEWNIIYSDPTNQDTDGDGTQDGFEFYSFRTSPVLADTDGDQISDTEEVLGRSRDPRIADLPRAAISVGEVRLQIDERYTYTDEQGDTVTAEDSSISTLVQSSNTTFSTSNTDVTEYVAGAHLEGGFESEQGKGIPIKVLGIGVAGGPWISGGGRWEWTDSNAFSTDRASAIESQRVHEQSLNKTREFSTSSTVTREVVGAGIDVDLIVRNEGGIAFTISNMEITVLERDRQSSDRFVPVATLIANSELVTGEPAAFNLGPFTPERGPIVFSSRDVFPKLVDQLMKSPSGLIFKVANFDMTDEFGRVFTFANQTARDRTAGIIVDFGDGTEQKSLVATAVQPDPDGFGGPAGALVGGFYSDGAPKGISLDFALQDILALSKNATDVDGIVAGPNLEAESIAAGDDVQLIPPGTTGVGVGSVVIASGQNGVLESVALGDDQPEITGGYETSLTCNAGSANALDLCSDDNQCTAGVSGGGMCSGPEVLVRFGGQRNGNFGRTWVVLINRETPAGADFGQVMLKPGTDITMAFVQDLDTDGLYAREEYMLGSTDSRADLLDNSLFGINFDESAVGTGDGIPDSKDTDRDGLGDFAEVRVGWKVALEGGLRQVYPSPRLRDSDGDGLQDPEEQDLSAYCVGSDPRVDGLCPPVAANPAATDPGAGDTDLDGVSDYDELTGFVVGESIRDGVNGLSETRTNGDDVQRSVFGIPVRVGGIVILPGPNGVIDSCGDPNLILDLQSCGTGDDQYNAGVIVVTDPLRRDTDRDYVADGTELAQAGNPTDPDDGQDFRDSDRDGLTDSEEALGWVVNVVGRLPITVQSNPSLPDSDRDGLPDYMERDLRTDPNNPDTDDDGLLDFDEIAAADFERFFGLSDQYSGFLVDGASSKKYGTDALDEDTDDDGITDYNELLVGYRMLLPGESNFRQIFTNPLTGDTDLDGLSDFDEMTLVAGPTDATDPDTDDDGSSDGREVHGGIGDPLVRDLVVTIELSRVIAKRIDNSSVQTLIDALQARYAGFAAICETVDPNFWEQQIINLYTANGWCDSPPDYATQLGWWFTTTGPNDTGPQRFSDARDTQGTPYFRPIYINPADVTADPTVGPATCSVLRLDNRNGFAVNTFNTTASRSVRLEEGESFALNGLIATIDYASNDCGAPPRYVPTTVSSLIECTNVVNETFNFEDFIRGTSGKQVTVNTSSLTCDLDLIYTVTVE